MKYELLANSLARAGAIGASLLAITGCDLGFGETENRLNKIEECLEAEYGMNDIDLDVHPGGHIIIPDTIWNETNACISKINAE